MRTLYRSLSLLLLCLIVNQSVYGQLFSKKRSRYKAAELYEIEMRYELALDVYQSLIEEDPNNANLNFKIGYCLFNMRNKSDLAILYLEQAVRHVSIDYQSSFREEKAPISAYYYLGRAYHLNYRFHEAITAYDSLKLWLNKVAEENPGDQSALDNLQEVNKAIAASQQGNNFLESPTNVTELNMGSDINSPYDDHSPVISGDESTLLFTSRRPDSLNSGTEDNGLYYEDIYISYYRDGHWTTPQNVGDRINTADHEATIGLSVDGQELFIYKPEQSGSIYSAQMTMDGWSKPEKLSNNINTRFRETHASLSADGKQLYFTSDRPGGYGGLDIYVAQKEDDNAWGEAQNLGAEVNTDKDEEGPFIHPDGKTLYFSSRGHTGMGGFDVFRTQKDSSNNWGKPTNMGYPINTTSDDLFFTLTVDGTRAYYASYHTANKESGANLSVINFLDRREKPLALVSGIVKSLDGHELKNAEVIVVDADTHDTLTITRPNPKTGKYMFVLHPGHRYYTLYRADQHLFAIERFYIPGHAAFQKIDRSIVLHPVKKGKTYKEYNVDFELNDTALTASARLQLDHVGQLLINNPKLLIEIAHSNNSLSQERLKATYHYLTNMSVPATSIYPILRPDAETSIILSVMDEVYRESRNKSYQIVFIDNPESVRIAGGSKTLVDLIVAFLVTNRLSVNIPYNNNSETHRRMARELAKELVRQGISPSYINTVTENSTPEPHRLSINLSQNLPLSKVERPTILLNNTDWQHSCIFSEEDSTIISMKNKRKLQTTINRLNSNENWQLEVISARPQTQWNSISMIYNYLLDYKIKPERIGLEVERFFPSNAIGLQTKDISFQKNYANAFDIEFVAEELRLSGEAEFELSRLIQYILHKEETDIQIPLLSSNPNAQTQANYLISQIIQQGVSAARINRQIRPIPGSPDQVMLLEIKQGKDIMSPDMPLVQSVFFDFNKTQTDKYFAQLDQIAQYLIKNPKDSTIIEGYADTRGSQSINEIVAQKRAKFIKDYLVSKGVDPNRVKVITFGENMPIASNKTAEGEDNPSGRQYNRRADIKISQQAKSLMITDISIPTDMDMRYTIVLMKSREKLPEDYFDSYQLPHVKEFKIKENYIYSVGYFIKPDDAQPFLGPIIDSGLSSAKIVMKADLIKL